MVSSVKSLPEQTNHLFWLTVFLVGSICFLIDYIIEYIRFNVYRNGSDYVRALVDRKIGESFTPKMPAGITQHDLEDLNEFMRPIKKKYMLQDKERERYLNDLRDKKL